MSLSTFYFLRYRLYGVNNTAHFPTASCYQNFTEVMERNFKEFFEIIEVTTYDV